MSPFVLNLLILAAGAIVGSFVNWAIYNLCYEERGPISPWSLPGEKGSKRTPLDFVPIIGWYSLRRDQSVHGAHYWVRPMLIEMGTAIGGLWFYHWQMNGGLVGGNPNVDVAPYKEIWFSGHALLITLMLVATFIDFDEKTIPDWITVPGTIAALLYAGFWPGFRLPEVVPNLGAMGESMQPINFHSNSPGPMPTWHHDGRGLFTVFGVLAGWTFALLPTTPYFFAFCWRAFRRSPSRFVCLTIAFLFQPARKTECKTRIKNRTSLLPNIFTMATIFFVLCGLSTYLFVLNPVVWDSYFGAILGLAFGGLMVWGVRIVGGYAMGQEAMGFGDVTLMAMIGAFLGWQAALLTFIFAPFAAMLIALVQYITTKRNDIAFGPYLCVAALVVLIGWNWIWNEWTKHSLFSLGIWLTYILVGALVALGLMLGALQWYKSTLPDEPDPSET